MKGIIDISCRNLVSARPGALLMVVTMGMIALGNNGFVRLTPIEGQVN